MFFNSWELWEQMTFILGAAILVVFAIGYVKLLYTNRLVRRQELVDEEKRMRIQELRNSGQIVESRKSHDIPFGVRAIQSGIQVDGIWISQGSTPAASELKLEHLRGSSSEKGTMDSSKQIQASNETSPDSLLRPASGQGRPTYRASDSSNLILEKVLEAEDAQRPTTAGTRETYRPRRASHLRYGSHGLFDEETLGHLEGSSPSSKCIVQAQRPRTSRHLDLEADSSAADNEISSSSDSDASSSHKLKVPAGSSPQSLLSEADIRNAKTLSFSSVPSGKAVQSSIPLHSSKAEYFSVPTDSPHFEASDPFATPLESPLGTPPTLSAPFDQRSGSDGDYQPVAYRPSRSPQAFVQGELHINKSVRKVNSGFEVLPAGTFGVPAEFKGKGIDMGEDEDSGEGRQSKLQKKPRTSVTGRIERP